MSYTPDRRHRIDNFILAIIIIKSCKLKIENCVMAVFLYKAADKDGNISRGNLESANADSAYNDLSEQGLYIISLKEISATFPVLRDKLSAYSIKRSDVIQFAISIAVMLKAGVPILACLEDVIKTTENKYFKSKISKIKKQVEMGTAFSDAVEPHKDIFPDILMRLTKIGEETGRLDRSLAAVADHLQKIENLTAAIKKALMYPAFVMVATFGALLFWLIFVMPKILALFQEMEVELPLITIILLEISNFTQTYWYIILLTPVAAFTLFQIVKKNEVGRYYIDAMKLKIPVAKVIIYNKLLVLFCEQMHILITAGITIDKCFDIVADIIGNAVFEKAVSKSKNAVSTGSAVSDALKAHKIFPQLIIRMVSIGEESGSLDDQFAFLGDHYIKIVDDISGKIDKMLEPIIIGVVGSIFAVMIVGLMLPIYDLVSNIK